jgi:hypothetical protein
MLAAEPTKPELSREGKLFEGLLSTSARSALARSGFVSFAPSSDADVEGYVQHFSALWADVDDGFVPDPKEVLRQMDHRESMLYDLWELALRNDFVNDIPPLVTQAPVTRTANPVILRSALLQRPLVVMSEGLWNFVCAAVMGILHWAEGSGPREAFGVQLFKNAAASWVANDPRIGPRGIDMARGATLDMETGVFGAGLADAVFTWAFLHEMGHFALGHLPVTQHLLGTAPDGKGTAAVLTYDQQNELAADAFGFERYLGLMPHSDEIRRNLCFGPQIDHAPIVVFELMDLAYRQEGATALLTSATHPAPLVRADCLLALGADRLSEEGREWYAYWEERLAAFQREVGA